MHIPGRTLSVAMLAALFLVPSASAARNQEGEALGRLVNRELRADGPFFTEAERALVARKCGYAPGEWAGFEANISNNVLTCSNGTCQEEAKLAPERRRVPAEDRRHCEICAGSDNQHAVDAFVKRALERKHTRLVVIGGSPSTREQLAALLKGRIELKAIDGTLRRTNFAMHTEGTKTRIGGATLVLGDGHPIADDLRSLGIDRKPAAFTTRVAKMRATFHDAVVVA